ncbi:uncharacterized protein LOC131720871 isoform X2 [Acipenser ruthenus]|uniref:uncharacterized protein LOC131720871 isoform X2 n=1 Tax=Acipenser ruthenus TaxID=7906 RepID=UPI0027416428|nr:uncharacterized protein LOC131720871 isoform X2 [Acipenser ruthenus]
MEYNILFSALNSDNNTNSLAGSHSPLPRVPDVEASGLEWFDVSLGLGAVQNTDQGVPSSPFIGATLSVFSSPLTNFTVPSTPVYFAMEKLFKLEEPSTGDRRVNEGTAPPPVAQVVPSSEKRTGKTEDKKKPLGKWPEKHEEGLNCSAKRCSITSHISQVRLTCVNREGCFLQDGWKLNVGVTFSESQQTPASHLEVIQQS